MGKLAPWDPGSRLVRRYWNRKDPQSPDCEYVELGRLANHHWYVLHRPSLRWQSFRYEDEATKTVRALAPGWLEEVAEDEDDEPEVTPKSIYGPSAW